jgi:branched-chain amino acid transport system ATP-binding protein
VDHRSSAGVAPPNGVGRIGLKMMGRPPLLLMDKAKHGLSPVMVESAVETIRTISEQGVRLCSLKRTRLMTLEIADYAYVMESGRPDRQR